MGLAHSKKYPSTQTLEILDETTTVNAQSIESSASYDPQSYSSLLRTTSESYSTRPCNIEHSQGIRRIPTDRKRKKKHVIKHKDHQENNKKFENFDPYKIFPGVRFKSGKGKAVFDFGLLIRPISNSSSCNPVSEKEVCIFKIKHSKDKNNKIKHQYKENFTCKSNKFESKSRKQNESSYNEYVGVPYPHRNMFGKSLNHNKDSSSHVEYMRIPNSKTDNLDTETRMSDINNYCTSEEDEIPNSIMLQNQNANNAEKCETESQTQDVNSILGQITKLNKDLLNDNYSAKNAINDSKNKARLSKIVNQVLKLLKKDETISSGLKSISQGDENTGSSRGKLLYKYESDNPNAAKTSETDSLLKGKGALKLLKIKGKKKIEYFSHNYLANSLTEHLKKKGRTNKSVRFHKSSFSNLPEKKQKMTKCTYSFHTYFEPSKVDFGILPFRRHVLAKKISSEPPKPKIEQIQDAYLDRRIKCVEKETNCCIYICELKEGVLIRGLPRRRVTINGPSYTAISKALVSLEHRLPELMENAVFNDALPIESKMWPSSKGDFVVRRFNSPFLFHKKCSTSTRFDSVNWKGRILPHRVFPATIEMREPCQVDEPDAEAETEVGQEDKVNAIVESDETIHPAKEIPTKTFDTDYSAISWKDNTLSRGSQLSRKNLDEILQRPVVNEDPKDNFDDNIEAIHVDVTDRYNFLKPELSNLPVDCIRENDTNDVKSILVSVSSSSSSSNTVSNTLDNFSSKNLLASEIANLAAGDIMKKLSVGRPTNFNNDYINEKKIERVIQSGDESCILSSKSSGGHSMIRIPLVYEYYNLSAVVKRNYPYKKILSFPLNAATSFLLETSNGIPKNDRYIQFVELQKSCGCQVEWIEPVTRFKSKKYLNMNMLYEDKESLLDFSLRMGFKFKKMPVKQGR